MKTKLIFLAMLTVLTFACREEMPESDNGEYREILLDAKSGLIVNSGNEFGFELFRNVFEAETEYENIMISPLSVSLALAMTYNGANGETKSAMEETLKLHGLTPEEINTSFQTLVNAFTALDPKVVLEIANAIFYRDNFKVEMPFIQTNEKYYDAKVAALDFNSDNALKTINNWVAGKTHGKIEKIINRIDPSHVMFLLNAIYFKGIWTSEFDENKTSEKVFYLENGTAVLTNFMQQTNSVLYATNNLFSAIELPYGQGNYSMVVMLPNEGTSLEDVVGNLDKTNWNNWRENFFKTNVDIQFPKFKYEYEIKLNDVLTEMGMGIAFSSSADFTGINKDGSLFIDYVKHKSFIEVNEKGTEAAAVTVVAIGRTSAGPPANPSFIVNRPFLYLITEKSTGAILFIGTVKNPLLN